jgi:hypothetical protein
MVVNVSRPWRPKEKEDIIMRFKRSAAVAMMTATLAVGMPLPVHARGHVFDRAGQAGGDHFGEQVGIGLGITTGAIALIGGALWYYFHHRNAAVTSATTEPTAATEGSSTN